MNYPFLKLPTVIVRSLGQNGGQVYFYQDWQSLLCGGEDGNDFKQQYLEEMLPLLGLELAPFRKQYQIGSCQLLCAVYPEERIIRIGTPRLARATGRKGAQRLILHSSAVGGAIAGIPRKRTWRELAGGILYLGLLCWHG